MKAVALRFGDHGLALVAGRDQSIAEQHFNALVIAIHGLAAVIDAAEHATGKFKVDDAGIQIADLVQGWVEQHISHHLQLCDFAAQVARHVKIVDGHIQEDTAGCAQILHGRESRIAAGDTQQAGVSHLAGGDHLAHLLEIFIEAPVESNLQLDACLRNGRQRVINFIQIEREWFFAEDLLSRQGGVFDDAVMRGGGGGN